MNLFLYRTRVERERANRIRICVWAYAYEFLDAPIATDAEFDVLVRKIDLSIRTGNDVMDDWFESQFQIDTGRWIHSHPDLEGIAKCATNYRN